MASGWADMAAGRAAWLLSGLHGFCLGYKAGGRVGRATAGIAGLHGCCLGSRAGGWASMAAGCRKRLLPGLVEQAGGSVGLRT